MFAGKLPYLWGGLKGLLEIAVVLLILSRASSTFERIAFALMILVYEDLSLTLWAMRMDAIKNGTVFVNHFTKIRKLLDEKPSDEESEHGEDQLMERVNAYWYVSSTVSAMVAVICLVAILLPE